jgi:hypothetical protein
MAVRSPPLLALMPSSRCQDKPGGVDRAGPALAGRRHRRRWYCRTGAVNDRLDAHARVGGLAAAQYDYLEPILVGRGKLRAMTGKRGQGARRPHG